MPSARASGSPTSSSKPTAASAPKTHPRIGTITKGCESLEINAASLSRVEGIVSLVTAIIYLSLRIKV
jgi:hypothetical protein